jgi:hypothetical protein
MKFILDNNLMTSQYYPNVESKTKLALVSNIVSTFKANKYNKFATIHHMAPMPPLYA